MLTPTPKLLVLRAFDGEAPPPKLRYTPLPGLAVADYVDDYASHLGQTGVFDYLSTAGSGVTAEDVKKFDLSALGVLGNAATRMLSTDGGAKKKRLSEIIIDHFVRFRVQVRDAASDDWITLDSAAMINAHLDAGMQTEVVKILGGEALRPLWSRLSSRGEERPNESPKPSPASAATS